MDSHRCRIGALLTVASLLISAMCNAAENSDPAPLERTPLNIVVYGSTGKVGSRIVNEALSRGHQVIAVSRQPVPEGSDNSGRPGLSFAQADALDADSMRHIIAGQDVVVLAVRGSVDRSRKAEDTIQRRAAELTVNVLRDLGEHAPRLLFVGGAGSLEVSPGVTLSDSIPKAARWFMPRSLKQEIAGQILTLEYLRSIDDVSWTYISPAKEFIAGRRTGTFRIGGDQLLVDESGSSRISIEDYALALVDECENASHIRTRISVAY